MTFNTEQDVDLIVQLITLLNLRIIVQSFWKVCGGAYCFGVDCVSFPFNFFSGLLLNQFVDFYQTFRDT